MKIKNIKHVFFDLDHTLWDFDKNSALTFGKIFEIHKVEVALDDFLKIYEPINLRYWKKYRDDQIDETQLRYGRLKDAFSELSFAVDDVLIHNLSQAYIEHLSTFTHLFQGTIEILQYLQPKYQLHIITNGFQEPQMRKMDGSAITSYFKTITNAEIAKVKKPNPLIFDFALKQAGAKAAESVMIGDNYEADILGALKVGYEAIFFNYRNDPIEPQVKQISSLSEIAKFL